MEALSRVTVNDNEVPSAAVASATEIWDSATLAMVPTPVASSSWAPVGLLNTRLKVSSDSVASVSVSVSTETTAEMSPAGIVTVPDAAV